MDRKDPKTGRTPEGQEKIRQYVRECFERAGLPVPDNLDVLTMRPSEEIRVFLQDHNSVTWMEGDIKVSIMRRGSGGPVVRLEFHPDGTCSCWVLEEGPLVVNPVFDKPRKVRK